MRVASNMTVAEAKVALKNADVRLRDASAAAAKHDSKDTRTNLRAAAINFAKCERDVRSAKKRENESDIMAELDKAADSKQK